MKNKELSHEQILSKRFNGLAIFGIIVLILYVTSIFINSYFSFAITFVLSSSIAILLFGMIIGSFKRSNVAIICAKSVAMIEIVFALFIGFSVLDIIIIVGTFTNVSIINKARKQL